MFHLPLFFFFFFSESRGLGKEKEVPFKTQINQILSQSPSSRSDAKTKLQVERHFLWPHPGKKRGETSVTLFLRPEKQGEVGKCLLSIYLFFCENEFHKLLL